jgi:hypothetical protein
MFNTTPTQDAPSAPNVAESIHSIQLLILVSRIIDQAETISRVHSLSFTICLVELQRGPLPAFIFVVSVVILPLERLVRPGRRAEGDGQGVVYFSKELRLESAVRMRSEPDAILSQLCRENLVQAARGAGGERLGVERLRDDTIFLCAVGLLSSERNGSYRSN